MSWKKQFRKTAGFPVYLLAATALRVLGFIPRDAAYRLSLVLGRMAYALFPKFRRVVQANLAIAMPQCNPGQIRDIAINTFANMCKVAVEFSRARRLEGKRLGDAADFIEVPPEVPAKIRELLARGKGLLYLTGHFGVWELLPSVHALTLPDVPLSIVVRPLDNPWMDRMVGRYRSLLGNRMIPKKNSIREIFAALHRNEAVGILLDQNVCREEGVFVDFFGKPACTNFGLAAVALKTGSPVLPIGLFYDDKRRLHRVHMLDEIPFVKTGDKAADLRSHTAAYTAALEQMVRQFPYQWLWAHCRWKTRPKEAPEKVYA